MRLKRSSIFTKLVILAVIVYALGMLAGQWRKEQAAESERQALQMEAERLQQENQLLRYEIDHAEDSEVLAAIARERMGLVMPGEKILYDVGD